MYNNTTKIETKNQTALQLDLKKKQTKKNQLIDFFMNKQH